jgi:hypothetical protein
MDDLFSILDSAAKTATTVATGINAAKNTAAAQPATATPQTSTAPSNKTLYLIGGIIVAGLLAVLLIPRLFNRG